MTGNSLIVVTLPWFFAVVAMLSDFTTGTNIELYRAGLCKIGDDDTVLAPMSYVDCLEECRARSQCLSINVYSRMNLCRLNFNKSLKLKSCDSFAYSEKSTWTKKANDGCENINCLQNQKCQMTVSGPVCANSECRRVTHIENGFVYGNEIKKGMRIAFGCRRGYSLIGRSTVTCMDDGFWSDEIPVCSGGSTTKTMNSSSIMTTASPTANSSVTSPDKSSDGTITSPAKIRQNDSVNAYQDPADNHQITTIATPTITSYNQNKNSDGTKQRIVLNADTTPISALTSKVTYGIPEDFHFNTNTKTDLNDPYQSSTASHKDSGVHLADTTTEIHQTQVSFVPEATQSIDLDQESTSRSSISSEMTVGFSESTTTGIQAWSSPKLQQTDLKISTALVDEATTTVQQSSTAVLTTSTKTLLTSVKTQKHGDPCDTSYACNDGQFECRDGLCQCFYMLVYEPNFHICVPGCSSYGDTFESYSDQTFEMDEEKDEIHTNTLDECFDRCYAYPTCNVI